MTMTPTRPKADGGTPYPAAAAAQTESISSNFPVYLCLPVPLIPLLILWRTGTLTRWLAMLVIYRSVPERQRRAIVRARQRELKQHQKEIAQERKTLKRLGKYLAREIKQVLAGVGYCYIYKNPGKKKKQIQYIRFSHCVIVGSEQMLFRVYRVPTFKSRTELFSNSPGSSAVNLSDGLTSVGYLASELYMALERQVQMTFMEDVGILIQVSLREGVAGIPRLVLWRDEERKQFSMMTGDPYNEGKGQLAPIDRYPDSMMRIPIGLGRNRAVVHQDLRYIHHLLVCGTTGSGKSNFLNQMICSLLLRNTPETLRMYLIDLKVVEFATYLRLSQQDREDGMESMVANVIQSEAEAAEELKNLYYLIERRQKMFHGVAVNIEGWNEQAKHDPSMTKLPYIIVFFDELSLIMLNSELKKRANEFISRCLAVGRSSGVHMVLCTQVISSQILSMPIRGNLPGKIVFRQVNRDASNTAIGDGRAWTQLEHTGMAFFCDEKGGEVLVQTPLIYEDQRDEVIQTVLDRMEGRTREDRAVTILDVCTYARENFKGLVRMRDMWSKFRGRISRDDLHNLIQAYYDKPIPLDPTGYRHYTIIPGSGSKANVVSCTDLTLVRSVVRKKSTSDIPPSSPLAPVSDNGKNQETVEGDPEIVINQPDDQDPVKLNPLYQRITQLRGRIDDD